jgi:hypothetical protein
VAGEREDQRHVDRVAARRHLLDRGHAGVGGRNLDQQVRARDRLVEVRRLRDRGLRVGGEVGFDLDRDVAVAAFRLLPDRSEEIAGIANVAHRQLEEDAPRVTA